MVHIVGSHGSYLICWSVSTAETKQASLLLDTICDKGFKRKSVIVEDKSKEHTFTLCVRDGWGEGLKAAGGT